MVALLALTAGGGIGLIVGIVAGYLGGTVDGVLMRVVDAAFTFPAILFALLFAVTMGQGLGTLVLAISLLVWASFARVIRGEVLTLRQRDFVALAKVRGCSALRIMLTHILPNMSRIIVAQATVLFGYAMMRMGAAGRVVHQFIDACSHIFFSMMDTLMKLAPLGAGGAMAFTIGRYGVAALRPLALLMGSFYLTCLLFIFVVLGTVAALTGFSIVRFVGFIGDEILTVLGTSSSESALVPLMQKLEKLGCSKSVVGLVVPSGYSFNLDGTNIYLTMAGLFVAQALNIDLTLRQQLTILGVAMLTSKGASGVTGAGFITLAATLAVVPSIPVAGLALILGIDRFMSEARSITNFIGNGVATIVVSHWEKELDRKQLLDTLK